VGGVEALLFYLVAYGAMTIGAFAVLHYLNTRERPIETVDDMAGIATTNPGAALLMALFLFSLIGIPLTAGFTGKFLLFFDALGLPVSGLEETARRPFGDLATLYRVLAVIGVVNAAVGAWYYLRVLQAMYLREPVYASDSRKSPALWVAMLVCAALTLWLGVYPTPLLEAFQQAVPHVGRGQGPGERAETTRPTPRAAE
jgi:NADH-quinone oxidoreductase subunit N